jgi:plasmid stabilization system protein ParE
MKIEILSSADKDLKSIEEYLLEKWSYEVLLDFYEKYDKALEILSSEIVVFSFYEDTLFRKFLLTKHNTIIYKIENETIYITRILQNFQNPEENYKDLTE